MGKSKKKKNQDFQKVKLKVGRTLKKADNVTNASFKSRSIQVVQSLKGGEEAGPSTKRKQNISELLSQFQHYNITVRHDAVTGLRELLTSHQELMTSHLAVIFERSSELFVDKDPAVRQAVVRLLKLMLAKIDARHVSPFFPIISAHLCCAMTHIYDDIQGDSLQILDLFLDSLPSLVVSKSSQLLPNFIEQISRQRNDGSSKGLERSLKVNPSSKMASQRWRTGVLKRLQKLLLIIMDFKMGCQSSTYKAKTSEISIQWSRDQGVHFQPFSEISKSWWNKPMMSYRLVSKQESSSVSDKREVSVLEEEGIQKFVTTIIPLLIDCWVESTPVQQFSNNKNEGSLLSMESLQLRSSILNVIQLLWRYISIASPSQMDWLRRTYSADFTNHFMKSFPYSVYETLSKKDKKDKSSVHPQIPSTAGNRYDSYLENLVIATLQKLRSRLQPNLACKALSKSLNLAICDIMAYFLSVESEDRSAQNVLPWQPVVIGYVLDVMKDQSDAGNAKAVIEILQRLIKSDLTQDYVEEILSTTFDKFSLVHPLSNEKRLYLEFLSSTYLSPDYQHRSSDDSLRKSFLQSLPEIFFHVCKTNQQMEALILSVMKSAACQKCEGFLGSLEEFLENVMGNGSLQNLDLSTQKASVELLFYLPKISRTCLQACARTCRDRNLSNGVCIYILQVLQERYDRDLPASLDSTALHVSFLLSVLFGDINTDGINQDPLQDFSGRKEVVIVNDRELWEKSILVTKIVSEQFKHFVNTSQVLELISAFIHKYMKAQRTIKAEVAISFLLLSNEMQFNSHPISEELIQTTVGVIWSFLRSTVSLTSQTSENVQNLISDLIDSVINECVTFIVQSQNAPLEFIKVIQEVIQGINDYDGLSHVCKTGSVLLQRQPARIAIQSQCSDFFHSLMSGIKTNFPEMKQYQWGSDFLYLASLIT